MAELLMLCWDRAWEMTWSLFPWEGWERDIPALPTQPGLWEGGKGPQLLVWGQPRGTAPEAPTLSSLGNG